MRIILAIAAALAAGLPAVAEGVPVDGAYGLPKPATRIMERLVEFHDFLLWIIIPITLFVSVLLLIVIVRYNKRANPVARKFSHNTMIEVAWTVIPALILIAIAGPSITNLFYQDRAPDLENIIAVSNQLAEDGETAKLERYMKDHFPEAAAKGFLNIKVQGNQWNWTYIYTDTATEDEDALEYISNPLHVGLSTDPAPTADKPKNLAVDYPLVIPANRYIRYYTAAADVIHSFAVPSFGIKTDAVPGRLNEGWFLVSEPGVYYGQCSELCGVNHAYMPIEVRVVPDAQFERWMAQMMDGDYEAANQIVAKIEPVEPNSEFAAIK